MNFGLVLALTIKDWRLFWADRRAAGFAFVVPIALASAFGAVFDRPEGGAARLPVLIGAADDGPFTRRVVAAVLASPRFEAREASVAEAAVLVADRRPGVAIVLPKGFEQLKEWRPCADGPRPRVAVLHHPLSAAERLWAEGAFTEIAAGCLAREVVPEALKDRAGAAAAPPFLVEATPAAGTGFNAYSHSFCGMTLQYLLFWGMEGGLLFLRERRRGVWARIRAAPVPLRAVLLGKVAASSAIALLQVFAAFGFGYLAFGVTVSGSVVGFVLLALAASGMAAATGLLVAAVGGTEARARSACVMVILGASLLGGLWLPAFLLPGWARDLAPSLPTAWAMRGLDAVTWQGRGLAAALPSLAAVAGFTALFLAAASALIAAAEARHRRGCP